METAEGGEAQEGRAGITQQGCPGDREPGAPCPEGALEAFTIGRPMGRMAALLREVF